MQEPSTAAWACCPQLPLQKLLFSATLTQNPEKLQQLGLHQPHLFMPAWSRKGADALRSQPCIREKHILPEGLLQYYVPCSLNWKPWFLLHFLVRLKFSQVLCFTNSKETTHRLFLLICAFGGVNVAEFFSEASPSKRKLTLKEFEQGKIPLLISTDATAQGIDFDGVKCVVSYDAPQFIRTYVQWVGRTAHVGKAGLAFTMLLKQQEYKFLKMLKDAGAPELQPQLVNSMSIQPLLQQYKEALAELAHAVKEEQVGKRL
ncbi:ATP-dependent RNA helicase DDX51-like [Candoia aspera]|uniref:ATP-dependent RNA helicase DDX51-like n=1 Tax=Candoia aspera TaxID=51853 RepID=UPI002FD82B82